MEEQINSLKRTKWLVPTYPCLEVPVIIHLVINSIELYLDSLRQVELSNERLILNTIIVR